MSKKIEKGEVEKEANPYDEADYWIWPNRRMDLNYASLTIDEVAELDRRVEGRGFSGAGLREIEVAWVGGGGVDRELAHAWHRSRGGLAFDLCEYSVSPLTPRLFRLTAGDAWSGCMYTDFCSVAEFFRVFIPSAVCIAQWLDAGIGRLDRGVSEKEFTFVDRGALVKCFRYFRLVQDRGCAAAGVNPGEIVLYRNWSAFAGWPDIYAFLSSALGWIDGLSRLKRLSLNRSDRREVNKFLNVIATMGVGNMPLIHSIAYDGALRFHEG